MPLRIAPPVLLAALLLAGIPGVSGAESPGRGPTRPNIVFILADDLGWGDLGVHGHPWLKTPNLDRLAADGIDFRQYTVASGVCSPSRAALLTGQFPARNSIHGHFATVQSHRQRNMPDWLSPKAVTLPRLLQAAGYATAHFGKWHLTNTMVPDAPLPLAYGYDEYGAFNTAGPQLPVHEDVSRAIGFIERTHAAGRPFFVNLWIHEPHTPHYPKPEFLAKFAALPESQRIYAAVIAHADARIGELLAALDRLGLAGNTLVVFSSDNGPEVTGPASRRQLDDESTGPGFDTFASVGSTAGRRGRKRSLLQGGIAVPFIVRWPGRIPPGQVDDRTPLNAVDMLPTLCAVAGAKLPAGYQTDGQNESAALLGTPQPERVRPLFWQWNFPSPAGEAWPTLVVRDGPWKLILGKDGAKAELFQFPDDELEKTDRAAAQPETVARLKAMAAAWREKLPAKPDPACVSQAPVPPVAAPRRGKAAVDK
jgi:arylsulfatase A-like enzyme